MDKRLLTIKLIILTEVLGFSLIIPFIPYMVEDFGGNPLITGLIMTIFSLSQFISSPIIGKLSDKFGRKPLLIISQLSTMTGFIILAYANSIPMIILSRIIDGLLGSNMTLSKAYISDITTGNNRRKQMSGLSAIIGLGMFIGPAIGGYLSTISYRIPSLISALITFITIVLTITLLNESRVKREEVMIKASDFFPAKEFIKGLKHDSLRETFITLALFSIGFSIITSSIGLFIKHQLNLGPSIVGNYLMTVGLIRLLFQTMIMPKLIDKKSINKLISDGLLLSTIGFIILSVSINQLILITGGVLIAISGGIVRPMISSKASEESSVSERGRIMGVIDSIWSVSRIISPLISGFIINNYYAGFVGLLAALLTLSSFIYHTVRVNHLK